MAETALAVQTVSETDITPTGTSADTVNGNSVTNKNGDVMLLIQNTASNGDGVVTITAQDVSVGVPGFGPLTKADKVVTVANLADALVGPFPKGAWNDGSDNLIMATTGAGSADVIISPFRFDQANL